jgi:hypothetical protein
MIKSAYLKLNLEVKNYNMKKYILILLAVPSFAYADGVIDIIKAASGLINTTLIPLAFSLCLLYFFWGMVKYIRTGANEDKAAEEGKRIMIWGVIGIFVAFSVWGIISFIQTELSIPAIKNVNKL